jgi:hypothetical protein
MYLIWQLLLLDALDILKLPSFEHGFLFREQKTTAQGQVNMVGS